MRARRASASSSPASSTTRRSRSRSRGSRRSRAPRWSSARSVGSCASPSAPPSGCPTPDVQIVELDVTNQDDLDGARRQRRRQARRRRSTRSRSRPSRASAAASSTRPGTTSSVALQVSAYSLKALDGRRAAADGAGRLDRRPRLRQRRRRLAGLRLDGRVEGRVRVGGALPRPRPRPAGHPREPRAPRARTARIAAKSIPGFEKFEEVWAERAPLGWDLKDAEPVAKACVALLSDWFPATTGEIVHVDGGFHAVGA